MDAAAVLFYEKGFDGVGVDEIGQSVGISGPALYRHFSGKDEILASLLTETLDELIAATSVVYDDPVRDLDRLIRHHVEFAIENRQMINVYQREYRSLVEPWRRHYNRRMRQYASRWEASLRRCFPEASESDIAAATQAAIGLIHSIAYWPAQVIKGHDDLPGFMHRVVMDGLSALDTPATAPLEETPVAEG